MKDFMFIFRGDGSTVSNFSPEEMQKHMQKWMGWIDKLKAKNTYVAGEPLQRQGKLVKGSKPVITDGPFAESKEVVGGYFIIKANSIEEAAEIAKDCPSLPINGSVEVREIQKM